MKINLLFFLLLFSGFIVSVLGQPAPQAELIDRFSRASCDDVSARVDNFNLRLRNDPTAKGYAVTSGSNVATLDLAKFELLLDGGMEFLRIDRARMILVRSAETDEFRVSFWVVPAGARKPDFKETQWNFILAPGTKPFRIDDDPGQGCESDRYEKIAVEFLRANARSQGNVLIRARSRKVFDESEKAIRGLFPKELQGRLKFFYEKDSSNYSGDGYASREFWLVPRVKK